MSQRLRTVARTLSLGLLILAPLAILACGGTNSSTDTSSQGSQATTEGVLIGNSVPQGSDPSLSIQTRALKADADRRGMHVISADANLDLNKQIADVAALDQKGIAALVIWPLDSRGIQPALERAQAAKIPVITRQTKVGGPYFTNLQADDVQAGYDAARYLGQELGRGAKVGAIFGPQQVESFRDLATGFAKGAKAAGLIVVDTQTNQDLAPDTAVAFADTWRQRYGSDVEGVFASLDAPALAVAATRSSEFNPIIVTYGGSDQALAAVRDGTFAAIMYQEPVLTGRAEAWAAGRAVAKKKLPTTLYVPEPLVDKSNIKKFPPSAEQLSAPMRFGVRRANGRAYLEVSR